MRDIALKMVYESVKHRVDMSYEDFAAGLKDWKCIPLYEDGEIIGGVIVKLNEIHIGYGKRPKAASIRRYIKEILNKTIRKYGHAVTAVRKDNPAGLGFCKRLGFEHVGELGNQLLLRCDRSKYD
jgi:hypothetical protein